MRVVIGILWWVLRGIEVEFGIIDEIVTDLRGRLVSVFFHGAEGRRLDD